MDNTDKSIKTRLLVVGAVIALWAFSMFPLKNKDFFQYVKNQAESSISSKGVDADTLKKLELAVEETYKAVQDKNVKATREAFKDAQIARADVISKKEEEDFAAAFKKAEADYANKVKKAITDIAPMSRQAALLNAAEGKIALFKFINTPGEFPTNKEVSKHIQKAVAGKIKYGIDLLGGVQFTMEFDPKDLEGKGENGEPLEAEATRDSIIEILRKRIDGKGLAEIEIRPFASTSILITVPNVNEEEVAVIRQLLLKQAKLEFRGLDPNGEEFSHVEAGRQPIRLGDVEMGGENIENAYATKDENGRWVIAKTFNSQGAVDFGEVTSEYLKKDLAIVLDGKIYSVVTIQSVITKNGQISGNFTKEEAEELALVLRSGAMPVELTFAGESRTDASLGAVSIKNGVMSCLTGLILVLIFMAFFYRKPGLIAVLALVVNILLVIGSMAILGGTFTLPGIAGIILTIGMAVDTNVLIFERIREELASGKTLYNSTREGFSRAFVTIFDANITTLLTAIILMKFGSGPIQGFAYTLAIGIIASMFTGIFMSRIFFDMMTKDHTVKSLAGFGPKVTRNIDFWGKRKVAMLVSAALITVSIISIFVKGSDALSVDFAGGHSLNYKIAEGDVDTDKIKTALKTAGFANPRIDVKQGLVAEFKSIEDIVKEGKEKFPELADDKDSVAFFALIDKSVRGEFTAKQWPREGQQSVGGVVGAEFRNQAFMAIGLSLVGIFFYIMLRFETIFAVGAIAALAHDTLIAMGIYILLGYQISLPVIAAILTIIGYSLNDTIVVFDRIRENSADIKNKKSFDIMNSSINSTLGRTILTSLTTLLVVVILVLFGGGLIADFAVVLLIGILVGTYSSIFVASPIVCNKLDTHLVKIHEDKAERELKRQNDQTVMVD